MSIEDIDYEKEHGIRIPPPLDAHIASVQIRTKTNNPADHFDLSLSAGFGCEVVTLISGDYEIRTKVSILRAGVQIDGVNCDFHMITDPHSDRWEGGYFDKEHSERAADAEVGGEAMISNKGAHMSAKTNVKARGARASSKGHDLNKSARAWRVIGNSQISIGDLDNPDKPLMGRIIDDTEVGIRVVPIDQSQRVGVLARLHVREEWIKFDDIEGNFPKSFWKSITGKTKAEKTRRQMFKHLLAHLVAKELQDEKEKRDATLSAAALVFRPVEMSVRGQTLQKGNSQLTIDPTLVEDFIRTEIGQEKKLLQEIGLLKDELSIEYKQKKFVEIWESRGPSWILSTLNEKDIEEAYSFSFGRICEVKKIDNGFRISFGEELVPVLGGEALKTSTSSVFWNSSDGAVNAGFCLMGSNAFDMAKAFGFPFGYQAFINRVKSNSIKGRMGYIIPLHAIFGIEEIKDNTVGVLSGLELKFSISSIAKILYAEHNKLF